MQARPFISKLLFLGMMLILWGCGRMEEPLPSNGEVDGNAILFDPGIALLRSDDTKTSTLIDRDLGTGDKFRVFCRRVGEGKNTLLFGENGTRVSWNSSATYTWDYSPLSYWYWVSASNYYDFLAMYPDPDSNQAQRMLDDVTGEEIPGNLAIKKSYALSDNYDMMLAGTRRTGANSTTRADKVPLVFQHMLSAVRVVVTNESTGTAFKLTSIKFDNIVQAGSAKVTIDAMGDPEFSWIDTQRTNADKEVFSGNQTIAFGGGTYTPAGYDLFIPGDLSVAIDGSLEPKKPVRSDYSSDGAYNTAVTAYNTALTAFEAQLPHLKLEYTTQSDPSDPVVTHTPAPIVLRHVKQARYGSADTIPEWEPGVKYTYNISVRLDGGVIVTVITTEWDEVVAETPGILI